MKKYKNKIFAILAIDKDLGGISTMIQHSTAVISSEAKEVNLFLLKGTSTLEKVRDVFKNNTKIKIYEIKFIEKVLIKLGIINFRIKKILLRADYIFFHNIKLLNILKNFKNIKPLFFFFHTDKNKHINKLYSVDHILTVNTETRNKINTKFKSKQAYYLPNCIDVEGVKVQKQKLRVKKKFVVGAMGRLVEKKGFIFLINAFKNLPDIELIIAGTGPLEKKLIKISKGYKNIKLIGWINDKESFFSEIDVFCLPSIIEPFGLVILEAMARGIPVISTNCKGPNDIIKNNYNGIIVKINCMDELIEKIKQLKEKLDLRKKISNNGLQTIKYKYSIEKYKRNLFYFLNNKTEIK